MKQSKFIVSNNLIRFVGHLVTYLNKVHRKNYHLIFAILIFFTLFCFAFFFKQQKLSREISDVHQLKTILNQSSYNLYLIRQNKAKVPRVFIKFFPKDFDTIKHNITRKNTFIQIVLPLILKVNEDIINERITLLKINRKIQNKIVLKQSELNTLYSLSQKYKVPVNDLDELMIRVDKIPISLALAQAIQETGWGKSYFLLNGNALFAEWTWKYDGMVPRDRDSKLHHRIKTFPMLIDAVKSYATILNTSKYYKKFRIARKVLHKNHNMYNSINLLNTMKYYSTTPDYLFFIKKIIIENSLTDFDKSELNSIL